MVLCLLTRKLNDCLLNVLAIGAGACAHGTSHARGHNYFPSPARHPRRAGHVPRSGGSEGGRRSGCKIYTSLFLSSSGPHAMVQEAFLTTKDILIVRRFFARQVEIYN